jgi:Na+/alanine symporter
MKQTQKYAIPVVFIVILAALAAIAGPHTIDQWFGYIIAPLAAVLLWHPPLPFIEKMPLVVIVLFGGAVFFTLRFKFINFRAFTHSFHVLRGKYDNPDDPGEVSHFQALMSALSATVGLGNIAGVAIAVSVGGPGAIFWMMVTALFGMTSKFTEISLGMLYRHIDEDGEVTGGPMVYLKDGLVDLSPKLKPLGIALSVIFTVLCIGASFGGGNMFQANQSFRAITVVVPWLGGSPAEGEVVLRADSPREFELPASAVRFKVPAASADQQPYERTYVPAGGDLFQIELDEWTVVDGQYQTTVPVRSVANNERFNVRSDIVTSMETGVIQGRSIKEWTAPEGISVSNPEPFTGGTNPKGLIFGVILALMVGLVIIGGIKSIARVAEKIVPSMCAIYVVASVAIIIMNYEIFPEAVATIFSEAFSLQAGWGALIGVFVQGVQRAAFSSEAGIGSSPIAHAAAKTTEPIREGIVGLMATVIDTIVICFMTGIVIIISGVYSDQSTIGMEGVTMTSRAFGSEIAFFPYVLAVAVFLFAFSTMISWSYYGERCWTYMFGKGQSTSYRIIFLLFIVLGSVSSLKNVLTFSDLMLLSMAFPNIFGAVILSGTVAKRLDDYWTRFKAGEFKEYK